MRFIFYSHDGQGVLLADKHPLGAHGELRGALDWVRTHGRSAVLGLRDILDTPVTVRQEWERGGVLPAIAEHFGQVLVYGCRSVLDPAVAYGMPAELAQRLTYCGYVASKPECSSPAPLAGRGDDRPVVLATAGAGTDGHALLSSFLRASQGAPWHPVVVRVRVRSRSCRIGSGARTNRGWTTSMTVAPSLGQLTVSVPGRARRSEV